MIVAQQWHLSHCLGAATSVYDPPTGAHCVRVALLAEQIAAQMNVEPEIYHIVRHAALLHDLGKVAIDPAVLNSDGPLSEQEWVEIRRHPAIGSDVLLAVSTELQPIAAAVRAHHERIDGGGYPDGLVGEQIPLAARILAVADVHDALTSTRLYRARPFTASEATDYLVEHTGTHFDGAVVEAAQAVLATAS